MKLKAFDLGGHEAVRKAWKNYFNNKISGVFFLIDSSNTEKFGDSRFELEKILTCKELEGIPIIILGNKIDLRNAVSEEELREKHGLPYTDLPLNEQEIVNGHPIKIYMCSLSKNYGYQ